MLDYEQTLTRRDPETGQWFLTSTHLPWIGARTNQPDGAHVMFLSGLANPVACEHDRYLEVLNGKWWRMGDMGFRGRWGKVYLMDREVDQIESMESNLEAEDVLMSRLDELREIAIVAGKSGEPVPVVCTREERPLDIQRWRMATSDLPSMTEPVQMPFDALPRTSTWKVRRLELTRLLSDKTVQPS